LAYYIFKFAKIQKNIQTCNFFSTFFAHCTVGEAAPRGFAPPWRDTLRVLFSALRALELDALRALVGCAARIGGMRCAQKSGKI